jgi:hypothetical protein
MCIGLHLWNPAVVGEFGLTGWFPAFCESLTRWCSSCISLAARCLWAQIGVQIAELDERRRGHKSADHARAETAAQALAAPNSGRTVSGFLWLDVSAGRGTGPDDIFAALADHISARRQHGIEQSKRQDFAKAIFEGPAGGRTGLPGSDSVDPGSDDSGPIKPIAEAPGYTGGQCPEPQYGQTAEGASAKTAVGNCGYCGRTQDRKNDLKIVDPAR